MSRAGTFRAAKIMAKEATELHLEYCKGRYERGERMTRHNLMCTMHCSRIRPKVKTASSQMRAAATSVRE